MQRRLEGTGIKAQFVWKQKSPMSGFSEEKNTWSLGMSMNTRFSRLRTTDHSS